MARRRSLAGRPLLQVTTGLALSLGCGGLLNMVDGEEYPPVGNIMPPPTLLCVDTIPQDAEVFIDGDEVEERCTDIDYVQEIDVTVEAEGHITQTVTVPIQDDTTTVEIVLPSLADLPPPPVGNIVAPPAILPPDAPEPPQ